jgi:hypothetical protein
MGLIATDDLTLLSADLDVCFVMSSAGRIVCVNSPDGEAAPRLVMAGCRLGNLFRLRHDVDEASVREVVALIESGPPWFEAAAPPRRLDALVHALSRTAPVESVSRGVIFHLPAGVRAATSARLVDGDTPEGRSLIERLQQAGMPRAQSDAGFLSVSDFWAPWCIAVDRGEIAAIAFAARLGPRGAEVGVYTFPGFRGRGLAAAVTARWSSLPELAGRRLFYSTQTTNRSSQRVAERLGLQRLGASLAIS